MAETTNLAARAAEPGAMAAVADPDQPPGEPGALATGILTKIKTLSKIQFFGQFPVNFQVQYTLGFTTSHQIFGVGGCR